MFMITVWSTAVMTCGAVFSAAVTAYWLPDPGLHGCSIYMHHLQGGP